MIDGKLRPMSKVAAFDDIINDCVTVFTLCSIWPLRTSVKYFTQSSLQYMVYMSSRQEAICKITSYHITQETVCSMLAAKLNKPLLLHVLCLLKAVASPGFVTRRGTDGNYVMGHSVQQLLDDLIVLRLIQYWSKELWVVDICTSWSRRLHNNRIVGYQIYSKVN